MCFAVQIQQLIAAVRCTPYFLLLYSLYSISNFFWNIQECSLLCVQFLYVVCTVYTCTRESPIHPATFGTVTAVYNYTMQTSSLMRKCDLCSCRSMMINKHTPPHKSEYRVCLRLKIGPYSP